MVEKPKIKEAWRQELYDLLMEYIKMVLIPTPGGLSAVARTLMELREIMLIDDLEHTFTKEAVNIIRYWIENTKRGNSYNLWDELREHREFMERVKEYGYKSGEGLKKT